MRTAFLFASPFLLAACSNPLGGETGIDARYGPAGGPDLPAKSGYALVSAAKVSSLSTGGTHRVGLAVGETVAPLRLTTSRNRILYFNVQGQRVSAP